MRWASVVRCIWWQRIGALRAGCDRYLWRISPIFRWNYARVLEWRPRVGGGAILKHGREGLSAFVGGVSFGGQASARSWGRLELGLLIWRS